PGADQPGSTHRSTPSNFVVVGARRAGCSQRTAAWRTLHGLASNAVTNDSAQTPPSAVARKCSNPNTVVARAGEFGKRPHTRIAGDQEGRRWIIDAGLVSSDDVTHAGLNPRGAAGMTGLHGDRVCAPSCVVQL